MRAMGRTGWSGLVTLSLLAAVLLMAGCQTPNNFLRKQGMDAYEDQQYATARAKFAQAVDQDASDWKAHYYLGLISLAQDQPLEAQLSLEKALSVRGSELETPAIIDALAESLHRQGKYENLAAVLQQATDRYGKPYDYMRQGKYLGKSGDVDGAKLAFQKAIRFAPKDDPSPFVALADFYDSLGSGADALLVLRQAYYIDPWDPKIAEKIRQHGMVPGPTVGIEPQR